MTFETGDTDNAHIVLRQLGAGVLVVEPDDLRQTAIAAAKAFAAANEIPLG